MEMFNDYLDQIFLMALTTFIFSALIMPLTNVIAHHIGAIDVPKDDRRVHNKPIPKLGGLGIFISFLFGYMLFGVQSIEMNSILIGSFIIILYGIIDDIKTLPSKYELIGQLIATSVIVFYGQILLTDITLFGTYINFGLFSYPITIFFILWCTNVIRLTDGLDGLSSGISSIFFLTIGIISFFQGRVQTLEITLAFIMLGSTLGFLVHNFYPAKLFAGEAGSAFMGFIIAIISLLGYKGTKEDAMKKRGFTLVELLGVIVILVIVLGLAVVSYVNIRNSIRNTYYNGVEESILLSEGDYYTYNEKNAML